MPTRSWCQSCDAVAALGRLPHGNGFPRFAAKSSVAVARRAPSGITSAGNLRMAKFPGGNKIHEEQLLRSRLIWIISFSYSVVKARQKVRYHIYIQVKHN